MTITLNGENSFGLQRELDSLMTSFVAEHGDLAIERVDAEEAEFAQIQAALTGLPFLSTKRLVILRRPSTNKQFVEQAEQLLGDAPETNEIILVEPKLDKRLSYYKFLKKQTDFREFPELDHQGLAQWLVSNAKQQNGSLGLNDARYLVERVGTNQQMLSNELEKLLLYDSSISRQSIDLLTDLAPQSTIFQLLEAAFAGDSQRALKLYAEQRALKVEPVQIIAMLAWQLHVLAIIKTAVDRGSNQIAQEAKINPYVLTKSQTIARNLSLAELKILVSDLLKIDTAMKRTSIDPDEALQHYLLKLAS